MRTYIIRRLLLLIPKGNCRARGAKKTLPLDRLLPKAGQGKATEYIWRHHRAADAVRLILFALQRIFHSRGHRTDPDWRAGLVGGIACEGHKILAGISIFLLEESTEPFDFRKRFFNADQLDRL